MKEDMIAQKETEGTVAEQAESGSRKNTESVEISEDAVKEKLTAEQTTTEGTVAEQAESESRKNTESVEIPEDAVKEKLTVEQPTTEEMAEENMLQEKRPVAEPITKEAEKEGTKKEEKTEKARKISKKLKIRKISKGKKKSSRKEQYDRMLVMVRIICVLGIVAFFCIPDKEKAVAADEVVNKSAKEDIVREREFPEIVKAEKEINERCEAYRSQVKQMAARYGIPQYTDLLMALMMQESGGTGLDIMQSSEGAFNTRYSRVPDGITDTSYSIECGVQELKEALVKAGAEGPYDIPRIEQALQAYNFGIYYLDFSEKKGVTEWNREIAAEYAQMASNGRTRDEHDTRTMGKWDYGDQFYPEHVLRYYPLPVTED